MEKQEVEKLTKKLGELSVVGWVLELEEIAKMVEEMVLQDEMEDAWRLEEDDEVMPIQDDTIQMEESFTIPQGKVCDLEIIITDETVHTPVLGPKTVRTESTEASEKDNPN